MALLASLKLQFRSNRNRLSWATVAIGVGVLGLLARFALAKRTLGSNDITTWAGFARAIRTTSLGNVYDTVAGFNHPPLMGWFAAVADAASVRFQMRFDLAFKAPMILAACVGAALIYRYWRGRRASYAPLAFVLFCWNPMSFLVSGYHGNTDSLCAMLSLLAALLMDCGLPFWGGLALAASINVKLIAVLLIPVLLSCTRSWKQALHFGAAVSLGALPFLPFVLFHWDGFRAHVLSYNSYPGFWGLTQLLVDLRASPRFSAIGTDLLDSYMKLGKTFVLLAPVVLAGMNVWAKRRWGARQLSALIYCVFLLVTPGFGVQYLVYPVLLLFAVNLRHAVTYSWSAGLYAAVVYFALWTGTPPAFSDFNQPYPIVANGFGYIAWALLLHATVSLARAPARA
ncbi:MAG: hypothetical protein H7X95_03625 [Deltaproteobacteria bacterium]|nr:hypothetical protein [Deltaproteobacteria bacterium]